MFKTIHLAYLGFILFVFCLNLFNDNIQKKIIRDGNYNIECYVSLDKFTSPKPSKTYFWFKFGEIHATQSDVGGVVLHDSYKKFFKQNQLIEKGDFNMGLKDKVWKKWYLNGSLKETVSWRKGLKHGSYTTYDSIGNVLIEGDYKNNLKTGLWVGKEKDTIIYKKGIVFIKPTKEKKKTVKNADKKNKGKKKEKIRKSKKNNWLKRLFSKKDKSK